MWPYASALVFSVVGLLTTAHAQSPDPPPCYNYGGDLCEEPQQQFTCAGTQCYWGEPEDYTDCSDIDALGFLDVTFACVTDEFEAIYEAIELSPAQELCVEVSSQNGTKSRKDHGMVRCYKKRLCKAECITLSGVAEEVTINCFEWNEEEEEMEIVEKTVKIPNSRCQSDEGGLLIAIKGDQLGQRLVRFFDCDGDPCDTPGGTPVGGGP